VRKNERRGKRETFPGVEVRRQKIERAPCNRGILFRRTQTHRYTCLSHTHSGKGSFTHTHTQAASRFLSHTSTCANSSHTHSFRVINNEISTFRLTTVKGIFRGGFFCKGWVVSGW